MSVVMAALREIYLQNERAPRYPEVTFEEAIHTVEEAWFTEYKHEGFPIRDLLAGNRYFIRFAQSGQLEVMLHQICFFMDEQRENWTRSRRGYLSVEKAFARTLYTATLAIRKNLDSDLTVKPPVDRTTFLRLMVCWGFEPFKKHLTKRQRNTATRYLKAIKFYYEEDNQADQNTMRRILDGNDKLMNTNV